MKSVKNEFSKTASYETLREWCIAILDFYKSEFPNQDMRYLINEFMIVISNLDKKRNIRKMRAMFKETNIMFGEEMLLPEQMDRLNDILHKKFSHTLADEFDRETAIIDKIIKRGKIRNDDEFEIVKRREEEIFADESQFEYAETLRNLMPAYE